MRSVLFDYRASLCIIRVGSPIVSKIRAHSPTRSDAVAFVKASLRCVVPLVVIESTPVKARYSFNATSEVLPPSPGYYERG